jgi:hypothetical protein
MDLSGFGELRWEPREPLDAGANRFAVRLDIVGVGHGIGAETRQEQWDVYLAEHGLIRSLTRARSVGGAPRDRLERPEPAQ